MKIKENLVVKKAIISFITFVVLSNYIYTATHTVTNSNDNGAGSLRQLVLSAVSGDTITFAVSKVNLTGIDIDISKNLTIIGQSPTNKVTISAGERRIFSITNNKLTISNLILTGANNVSASGGAVFIPSPTATFIVNNCVFENNIATYGPAVYADKGTFIANNCVFRNNTALDNGGAVCLHSHSVITNSTFYGNKAVGESVIHIVGGATVALYHCTIIDNQASKKVIGNAGTLYLYNNIIVRNIPNKFGEIVSGNGSNLIEGINGVTRDDVLGTNQFNNSLGCIFPLPYAATAEGLKANTIQFPNIITADEIINKLKSDQIGQERRTECDVTYGAVEVEGNTAIYSLTINTTTGGTTNQIGLIEFNCDTTITLIATPDSCYSFVGWSNGSTNDTITITIKNDTTLTANFLLNSFDLVMLNVYPESTDTAIYSGRYNCGEIVTLIATPDSCYSFVGWSNGSTSNTITILIANDTTLMANFVRDSFNLVLKTKPENAGTLIGAGRYACGDTAYIEAMPDIYYNFINWIDTNDNEISNQLKHKVVITKDTILIANFYLKITIRTDAHKLVSSSATNYSIPIYIKSDKDIDGIIINTLIIEIDKNIFCPRSIDNGYFANYENNIITIKNIEIPTLQSNQEIILLNVLGDILLGKDSSGIVLRDVVFDNFLPDCELIDGCITINICEEGGNRLLEIFDYSPSILINNNPATNTLEIEIKVIENGNYTLEIVDLLGNTEVVKEFIVANEEKEFNFNIPLIIYSDGSYILVLNTPTSRYSEKFVIRR